MQIRQITSVSGNSPDLSTAMPVTRISFVTFSSCLCWGKAEIQNLLKAGAISDKRTPRNTAYGVSRAVLARHANKARRKTGNALIKIAIHQIGKRIFARLFLAQTIAFCLNPYQLQNQLANQIASVNRSATAGLPTLQITDGGKKNNKASLYGAPS